MQKNRKKIAFITTTMGTKWEAYSQALLETKFSEFDRILIDGTSAWNPLNFIDRAVQLNVDFLIHIDEDCFLFDDKQLLSLIEFMECNDDIVIAGTHDGGTFHRDHNPRACNLFFLVIKLPILQKIIANYPNWKSLKFDKKYVDNWSASDAKLDLSRTSYDDFEQYYCLFWLVLKFNYRIFYLQQTRDNKFFSSNVYYSDYESKVTSDLLNPMVVHMWWLRKHQSKKVEPYLGVSHWERYSNFERHIVTDFDSKMKLILLKLKLKIFFRRIAKYAVKTSNNIRVSLQS